MRINKLMHVCVAVPDLEKALDFYCGVLGFKSVFQTDNDEADGILLGFDSEVIGLKAQHIIAEGSDPSQATEINLVEFKNPKTDVSEAPYSLMNHIGISRLALSVDSVSEVMAAIKDVEGVEVVAEGRDVLIVEPDVTLKIRWGSFKDPFGVFITLAEAPQI